MARTRRTASFGQNRGTASAFAQSLGASRFSIAKHYRPQQPGVSNRFPGHAPGFADILRLCAMQRLMQALGAYGFLGLVKSHKHFLKHVPAAMTSLAVIVSE